MKRNLLILTVFLSFCFFGVLQARVVAQEKPYTAQEDISYVIDVVLTGEETLFTVDSTGTSIDGIEVKIPKDAVPKGTQLKIGYEKGSVSSELEGRVTETALVIQTPLLRSFVYPLEVTAPSTFSKANWRATAGFAIDRTGRGLTLSRLRSVPRTDKRAVTFYTFRPLKMIWMKF